MSTKSKSQSEEPEAPVAPRRQTPEEVFAAQKAAEEAIIAQGRPSKTPAPAEEVAETTDDGESPAES